MKIKLFNSQKTKQPESTIVINEKTIEEQIYNDVYSAHDLLLKEAERALSIYPIFDSEKTERLLELEKIGFSGFDEIEKLKEDMKKRKEHSELKERINYYSKEYPFNRFISKKSIKTVMDKYNLILARANDYISDIPEKNQNEILNFRVKKNDIRYPREVDDHSVWLEYPPRERESVKINLEPLREMRLRGLTKLEKRDYIIKEHMEIELRKTELIVGQDLLIMAPIEKLNITGKKISKGILRIINEDPIVLQPVVLGYLIVSSWGLEASDPIIFNSINN